MPDRISIKEIASMPEVKALPLKFRLYILRSFVGLRKTNTLKMKDGKVVLSAYLPLYPSKAFKRFVEAQLTLSKGEDILEIVNFAMTHKCRHDCWHCISPDRKGVDLELDLIQKTISELEDLGAYSFLLTGGDPLMRKDVFDIVQSVGDRAIVNISTPGCMLTKKTAEKLKNSGAHTVFIGLDHSEEEKNNEMRGYAKAYKDSLKGIENAKQAGLLVALSTVATKERIESREIFDFLDFAKDNGVDDVAIFEPIPAGKILSGEEHLLSQEEREHLFKLHTFANKRENYPRVISGPYMDSEKFMGCTAGFNRLYVDSDGNVYPCEVLPFSYGNIKEESIKEIWKKMHNDFQKPRCRCLMLDNYKKINESKDHPLPPEKCRKICAPWEGEKTPLFYKKLGLK
jgi:radical SAM protein with 4Fe4S-binding SPASM domain